MTADRHAHQISLLKNLGDGTLASAPGIPAEGPSSLAALDADGDGRLDISDSIRIFGYLFLGTAAPSCLKAADADDSGAVDLTDGIFSNLFLFSGGRPVPLPGPATCGCD